MTRMKKNLGDLGENFARGYFSRKGYTILFAPFRSKFGEIDIIMKKTEILIFAEVKTRRGNRFGSPLEAITLAKQRQIIRTANFFLKYVNRQPFRLIRFDVLGIEQGPKGSPPEISHIQDAFRDDSRL